MQKPAAGAIEARRLEVETPEQVVLRFELADLGSRFLAFLLDGLLLSVLLAGLATLAAWAANRLGAYDLIRGWALAILVLLAFTVAWGYFVYFEVARDGQTPGKRGVGLRVVLDGAHPVSLQASAIRNLLRAVDMQPFPTSLLGGLVMMLHPQTKRLGDLAAGTLVVRERSAGRLPRPADAGAPGAAGAPLGSGAPPAGGAPAGAGALRSGPPDGGGAPHGARLTDAQFDVLDRYVARRDSLAAGARERIATELARALGAGAPLRGGRPADAGGAPADAGAGAPLRGGRPPDGGGADEWLVALHGAETSRRAGAPGRGESRLAAEMIRRHGDAWAEYEKLLEQAQRRGLGSLGEEAVSRLAGLYRLVSADVARARTYGASDELAYGLERRATEGHNLFYRRRGPALRELGAWLTSGFPRLVRRRSALLTLAAGSLFGPAIVSYALVAQRPALARELLPAGMIARAELTQKEASSGRMPAYVRIPDVFMPVMATGIISNNVQVTFFAFAGGILAGVGTLLLLALNGISLGATAGLYHSLGIGRVLWMFVAPHGVLELTAVCISGTAGLLLGSALIVPGRLRRVDALKQRAREAVSLLAGTAALLVLAGLVEGFVSPAPLPAGLKMAIAGVIGAACVSYVAGAGRRRGAG